MGNSSRSRRSLKGTTGITRRLRQDTNTRTRERDSDPVRVFVCSCVRVIWGARMCSSKPREPAEVLQLVRPLPRQVQVLSPEVAVRGDLPVDGPAQLELADEAEGAEVERL